MRVPLAVIATLLLSVLLASPDARADCNHPPVINPNAPVETDAPTTTIDCYQVALPAGQRVSVAIAGAKNDAVFAVFAPGWTASCNAAEDCDVNGDQLSDDNVTRWLDTAPAAGAYLIVVDNSKSDADYRLTVELQIPGTKR
jgi:hypothetical protein